jgi:hypothetical protein
MKLRRVFSLCFFFSITISDAMAAGSIKPYFLGDTSVPQSVPLLKSQLGDEPSYCDLGQFIQTEVQLDSYGTSRIHAFQLEGIRLIGMGVGKSNPGAVEKLAQNYTASEKEGFCTWYFHHQSVEASNEFKWRPVRNPKTYSPTDAAREFSQNLRDEFSRTSVSFLSCMEDHKYLAMGCQNMKHRGPSVFAMFLAYTGCQPENALVIANYYWGLNGVAPEVRLEIAREGYRLGNEEFASRKRMQALLLGNSSRNSSVSMATSVSGG